MQKLYYPFVLFLVLWSCHQNSNPIEKTSQPPFALVIHGGARTILNSEMTADQEAAFSHL